jgi:hypothetical protein
LYGPESECFMELMKASNEWAKRPMDQRYLSLTDLREAVEQRKRECWTVAPATRALRVVPEDNGQRGLGVEVLDPTAGVAKVLRPTNWAFGQLAQYAKAPAAYLRTLPDELAAINLQWGLERNPMRSNSLMLAQSNDRNVLRSMTSTSYGRIWDEQVVRAVERINEAGNWVVPAASYASRNPKRATTLYASDRDVFIFLVDQAHPIEVDGETLYRGFYTWNSEVGSAVYGLTTFLYRTVCDNRIIWGAQDVQELRIRHTGGAPERFAYEARQYLREYSERATGQEVSEIRAAKAKELPTAKDESVEQWLRKRGFTQGQSKASVETAKAEQGQCRSVWDVIQGITAYARSVEHTDARVKLETQAGALMQIAQ